MHSALSWGTLRSVCLVRSARRAHGRVVGACALGDLAHAWSFELPFIPFLADAMPPMVSVWSRGLGLCPCGLLRARRAAWRVGAAGGSGREQRRQTAQQASLSARAPAALPGGPGPARGGVGGRCQPPPCASRRGRAVGPGPCTSPRTSCGPAWPQLQQGPDPACEEF